jgi:hypothetical protein
MPEPTTAPDVPIAQIREWLATQQTAEHPCDAAERGSFAGRIGCLLWAYEEAIREIRIHQRYYEELRVAHEEQYTRAAAAEAAVQRVRERAEREYVIALNAVLASPNENADVHRWRGHAEALRQVAEQCCRESGVTVPAYRSDEWRRAHGVYTPEQIARWNSGSAGQPVGLAGKGGAAASAPALPADPTPRVMPPEIPLSAVAALDDGQSATVTAELDAVHVRTNQANAPCADIVLVDDDTDTAWGVKVSPAAYAAYRQHLQPHTAVTAAIAASRDDTGLTLWLTAIVPAWYLNWDAIDETAWLASPNAAESGGVL